MAIQEHIFEIIWSIAGGAILAFVGYAFKVLRGLVVSSLAVSHDKLYRYAEFYILTNQITVDEMKNLEHIYRGYHLLGGNGTGTELFEKCKEIPVVERRTKWNPYYLAKMEGEI